MEQINGEMLSNNWRAVDYVSSYLPFKKDSFSLTEEACGEKDVRSARGCRALCLRVARYRGDGDWAKVGKGIEVRGLNGMTGGSGGR